MFGLCRRRRRSRSRCWRSADGAVTPVGTGRGGAKPTRVTVLSSVKRAVGMGVLAVGMVSFSACSSSPAPQLSIVGRVTVLVGGGLAPSQRKPLAGARLEIQEDGRVVGSIETDRSGSFHFRVRGRGVYVLRVIRPREYESCDPASESVDVQGSNHHAVDFVCANVPG